MVSVETCLVMCILSTSSGGFEARRDQQVLEVLVAAVVEKLVDDLLRVETKREAFRSSAIEPIVEFSQVEGRSWSETRFEHRII